MRCNYKLKNFSLSVKSVKGHTLSTFFIIKNSLFVQLEFKIYHLMVVKIGHIIIVVTVM